jgi:hypothetical protein
VWRRSFSYARDRLFRGGSQTTLARCLSCNRAGNSSDNCAGRTHHAAKGSSSDGSGCFFRDRRNIDVFVGIWIIGHSWNSFSLWRYRFIYFAAATQPSRDERKSGRRATALKKIINGSSRLTAAALSAIAASIATATIAPATAAWRPWFARARLINGQRSAFERLPVYFRDCLLRVLVGAHGHKREAAGFAGKFVLHEHDFLHRACLRKELL